MDPQQTYVQKLFQDVSNALAFFTTPEFLVLCLLIAIIVIGIRKVAEFVSKIISDKNEKYKSFINNTYSKYLCSEIIVPAMPLIVGGLFARIVTTYPYPADFKSLGGRVGYGIIAGLLSAYVYPRVKYLYQKLQSVPKENSNIPQPDPQINPVLPIPTEPVMPVINPQPNISTVVVVNSVENKDQVKPQVTDKV